MTPKWLELQPQADLCLPGSRLSNITHPKLAIMETVPTCGQSTFLDGILGVSNSLPSPGFFHLAFHHCTTVQVAALSSTSVLPTATASLRLISKPFGVLADVLRLPRLIHRMLRYFLAYCGALAVQGPPISGSLRSDSSPHRPPERPAAHLHRRFRSLLTDDSMSAVYHAMY